MLRRLAARAGRRLIASWVFLVDVADDATVLVPLDRARGLRRRRVRRFDGGTADPSAGRGEHGLPHDRGLFRFDLADLGGEAVGVDLELVLRAVARDAGLERARADLLAVEEDLGVVRLDLDVELGLTRGVGRRRGGRSG